MRNFVISLKSAKDRRQHIISQFSKADVEFNFFDAIEPQNAIEVANSLELNIVNLELSKGELGCLLSHVSLWKKAIDENMDYIAIFEDDIYLSLDANYFLNNNQWMEDDIGFIKIEQVVDTVLLSLSKKRLFNGAYSLAELKSYHLGTGGYILSNKVANSLYNYIKQLDKLEHIDQIMFRKYMHTQEFSIYQLNPVLCIQDCILNPTQQKFDSTLQWRETKQNKLKLSIFKKTKRELERVLLQFLQIPFRVKLKIKL